MTLKFAFTVYDPVICEEIADFEIADQYYEAAISFLNDLANRSEN